MVASAQGVDISDYQAEYTVDQIKSLDFIFIKATEGTAITDPHFAANWKNAKAAGKPRGAYHFFHPGENADSQASHFTDTVKAAGLEPGDMLIVDSELLSGVALREFGHMAGPVTDADNAATATDVDAVTKDFLDTVKDLVGHDYPLIVYTMAAVGQHLTETAAAYPLLWFAHPSGAAPTLDLIAPWRLWTFWQWSWSNNLDKDAYDGTEADLEHFISLYRTPPKPPVYRVEHYRVLTSTTLAQEAAKHKTTPEAMIATAAKARHRYASPMQKYIKAHNWNARLPRLTELFYELEVSA